MIKERGIVIFLSVLLLLVLVSASVSSSGITGKAINGFSSFIDFVKSRLSGGATTQGVQLNISIPNSAPIVTFVSTIASQSIVEATEKAVTFSFIVYDQDGNGTIVGANATFRNYTSNLRYNSTCQKTNVLSPKEQNFSCTVGVWYFDNPGMWNVSVVAVDTQGSTGVNSTTNFTILETLGFVTSPETLTWESLVIGYANRTALESLQLNNTANVAVGVGNVSINSTNLVGETFSSYALYAANFSLGLVGEGNSSCNATTSNSMIRSSYVNITGAFLPYGNLSVGGQAKENIYACIRLVGPELYQQNYSTAGEGAWTIRIQ